jgi:hypothetical protein
MIASESIYANFLPFVCVRAPLISFLLLNTHVEMDACVAREFTIVQNLLAA